MAVPRIIHQLWKDADVPDRYQAFRAGWRRHQPDWEHRLWTDADLLALVETRYPEWRSTYLGDEQTLARADLGRYLVLDAFGGVYVDLDCECLRPVEPLLEGASFAIGLEPVAHNRDNDTDPVICISFIAAEPGHPFCTTVLDQVRRSVGQTRVLEQTGPLMMNRAYARHEARAEIRLLPAALVCPFTEVEAREGAAHDIEFWERATRDAFVAHYWDNSSATPSQLGYGLPVNLPAQVNAVAPAAISVEPLISCLMTSRGDLQAAKPAIEDYLDQTYANRELVIGAPSSGSELADYVAALRRPDVRLAPTRPRPADGPPLDPDLLVAAAGEAVCAWEESVQYDPRRLEIQQTARAGAQSHASLLARRVIWQPSAGRIGIGAAEPIAGSILGDALEMRVLARHATLQDWRAALDATVRTAVIDMPRLMLETFAEPDAFEARWESASVRFPEGRTKAVVEKLADRLAIKPG